MIYWIKLIFNGSVVFEIADWGTFFITKDTKYTKWIPFNNHFFVLFVCFVIHYGFVICMTRLDWLDISTFAPGIPGAHTQAETLDELQSG